mgnify:CR=1 FL=1
MNDTTKVLAVVVSGALGFIIPTYFAWTLYADSVPQNVVTWGMVFVLDLLAHSGVSRRQQEALLASRLGDGSILHLCDSDAERQPSQLGMDRDYFGRPLLCCNCLVAHQKCIGGTVGIHGCHVYLIRTTHG